MKRPQNLVYALDEAPPPLVTALNGIQHVGLIAINLVYPLLVFRVADTPASVVAELLAMGMIVLGIAAFLHARRLGPLGSGFMSAGLLSAAQFATVQDASWVALPHFVNASWSFDVGLVASFAIVSLAAAMKAVGTIAVCQRINDADWVRPDMQNATRGVLADGVSIAIAGAMGAVGLASATGVASRRVAYAAGGTFLLLGFMPKLAALLAIMPRAVMVAALMFEVCFIIINGLQVIASRLLDVRRTIVIGLAIVAGVAIEAFPVIAENAPEALLPVVGSALVFSTLIALVLNLLFRLG